MASSRVGEGDTIFAPSPGRGGRGREVVGGDSSNDVQRPMIPPEPTDVPIHFKSIQKWLDTIINLKDEDGAELNRQVCQEWRALTDIFKHCYPVVKESTEEALLLVLSTLDKVKLLCEMRRERISKDATNHCHVCTEALQCMTALMTSINQELDAGDKDIEFLKKLDPIWRQYIDVAVSIFLRVDVTTRCALLDVIAAFGKEIFCRVPDQWQKRLMVFVLGYADDKDLQAQIRAKFGRCIAKMIEFPPMREDVGFLVDSFTVTKRNITKGENTVKISYAWTFGNLTDALIDTYMDTGLETKAKLFVIDLLETALKSTEVPLRGRYSACRGCGNVFKWLKFEMLQYPEYQGLVKQITNALIGMIGTGLDYKLRWNAARAVGQALENEIFFMTMENDVTLPIIKALSKWVAQSQNYKERIQCVLSLGKVVHRRIYGTLYPHLWERLCLAESRLPVEDSENMEKFKIEVLLLILHLINLVRQEDLEALDGTIAKYSELLNSLVLECVAEIPLERLNVAITARDNLYNLKERVEEGSSADETLAILLDIVNNACTEMDGS